MVEVAALLDDPELALKALVLAEPGQEIRWVASSELPDPTPFFQGGELLLTTGLQTAAWTTEWRTYVEALVRSGTVGVGFGIGINYTQVPRRLVSACRGAGLNLFEVPRPTPFVAISHRVSRLLMQEEQASAGEALEFQRRLTAAAAKPNGARAVLPVLAHALQGAAALLTVDGDVLMGPVGARRGDLDLGRVAEEILVLRRQKHRTSAVLADPSGTTVVQPVGTANRRSPILAALGPPRLTLSQRSAVTTSVALLGLIAEQEHQAQQGRRIVSGRAVELLVAGDWSTADVVLGIDSSAPGIPKTIRIVHAAGPAEMLSDALDIAESHSGIGTARDGQLWVAIADSGAAVLADRLARIGMTVGVGSRGAPDDAPDSHRTAGIALTQATSAHPVVGWDDLVHRGPLGLIDPADAAQFATALLGEMTEEQITTLRCFLTHHGSHLKVSQALGIHRNTVRNRLAMIETKLRGSLEDPQLRVNAWVALQTLPESGVGGRGGGAPHTGSNRCAARSPGIKKKTPPREQREERAGGPAK
ncbi:PucR family transcriptional regulator, partial [Mycobacterium sp. ACS4331]|uniref:PucR family transcriptional regulator n=1 Tax=Mycobacterium sp. ACS4331 TaxID=1834121 RepID=UPI0007FD259D